MTHAEAEVIVEAAAADLGEHFEAVQILVTWRDGNVTRTRYGRVGNFNARTGMTREFLVNEDAKTMAHHSKMYEEHEHG